MTFEPAFAEPETAADQAAEDAQYYRRVLHELIDMGAELARLVVQGAADAAGPEVGQSATVAFERVTRVIRRTILLARKVAEPVAAARPARLRMVARSQIIRAVEDTIERDAEPDEAEELQAELLERLDGPDVEDDIGSRPVAEIIVGICRDLGLAASAGTYLWKRRTPEDVAALFARAAAPRMAPGATGLAFERDLRLGRDAPAEWGVSAPGVFDGGMGSRVWTGSDPP